jgi:GNAT superfamily N-acetyltransferase
VDRAEGRVQTRPVPPAPVSIRATHASEPPALQAIETAAGRQFIDVGLAEVAGHPPQSLGDHERYRLAGRSWVAVDDHDRPVAFLLAGLIDGNAHVEEVSVHPAHARRRIGAALLDHLAAWAGAGGLPAVTLTTFAEVPWNAPYYERCGFVRLDDRGLPPGLAAIRRTELTRFDAGHPRVAMTRPTV